MKLTDEEVSFPVPVQRDGQKSNLQVKMRMYSLRVNLDAIGPYLEEGKLIRALELNREPLQFEVAMKAIVDDAKKKLKEKSKEMKQLKVAQGLDYKKFCKHLIL